MPFKGSMVLTFGTEYSILTSPSNAEVIFPRLQLCNGSSASPEVSKIKWSNMDGCVNISLITNAKMSLL